MTAKSVFENLIEMLKNDDMFIPESQKIATVNTLRQKGSLLADLDLSLEDLKNAFEILSIVRVGDDGAISGRRNTLRHLAFKTLGEVFSGDAKNMIPVLTRIAEHFAASEDPRQKNIAKRASREATELTGWLMI